MPARKGEAWNDEDMRTLRTMGRAGATVSEIARRLERGREAVHQRGRKMGLALKS